MEDPLERVRINFSARQAAQEGREKSRTRAAEDTKDLIAQLVQSQLDSEARETKMLFWSRVAGAGAALGVVVGVVALVVALCAG